MSATVTSSYLNRKTPGVYVTEIPAFGNSIVGVDTAVPVFIGYTQFAADPVTGKPLYNTPVEISSMTDFTQIFGYSAPAKFTVALAPNDSPPLSGPSSATSGPAGQAPSFNAMYTYDFNPPASEGFVLKSSSLPNEPNQFNLYWTMQAFFANGGGQCFVVSVGSYWSYPSEYPTTVPNLIPDSWLPGTISASALEVGLEAAGFAMGPTMIVIPEACQLATFDGQTWTFNGYDSLMQQMLQQASTLQDRVAIIDLPGCQSATTYESLTQCQNGLSLAIAPQVADVSYGAAYAPALNTTIVSSSSILYSNLTGDEGENEVVNDILTTQAQLLYANNTQTLASVQAAIAQAFPVSQTLTTSNTAQYSNDPSAYVTSLGAGGWTGSLQQQSALDNLLLSCLPVFQQIEQLIANTMNILPPSGLMAGVWTKSDSQNGVWNAPANIALASVASPLYIMNDAQQAGFNMPTNGESVCVIRAQPTRGNIVWGARTLDGNSGDNRYVQVRRTLIYVEQSIKLALQSFVFAANDATTWTSVTASVSSFLTGLWQQGGLMGSKPSEAFTVKCGLGSTMTAQNVIDGYMIVAVTLQMIHPAEFIELTFTQTMGA
jgi:phage tail sheath protein FI